jgi:drug/metabolite transporter (DMT)-like permease
MAYLYILGTILCTVYGQLILKFRIVKFGTMPELFYGKIIFLLKLFLDPFVLSGFISAFFASLFWMAAMTKFELSFAYPFMGVSFILVLLLSWLLLGESMNIYKIAGVFLITLGLIISSKGM